MSSAIQWIIDPVGSAVNATTGLPSVGSVVGSVAEDLLDDNGPTFSANQFAAPAAPAAPAADMASQGPQAVVTRPQNFSNTFTAGGITPLGGRANIPGVSTLVGPKKRAASRALVG
jgi:hypothetical protein